MAVVSMNNLINGKDSRWLQLEVCREFQRNKCTRPDTECKFAHPPANVEVQNGKVIACYDSIKGRCNRERPPCKYFHPPQHLKDQLLINGRNHLALKNALLQQMGISPGQSLVTGQVPTAVPTNSVALGLSNLGFRSNPSLALGLPALNALTATNPYLQGLQQVGSTYSPFFPGHIMPTLMGHDPGVGSPLGCVQQTIVPQKLPRSDRLEMDMKSPVGSYYYENFAFPGMLPYKRAAGDKSGMPVYQPGAYQQLMQPYVPVSCEYSPAPNAPAASPPAPEPKEKAKLAAAALSYTGVSLNKQLARGFAYPFAPPYQMPPHLQHTLASSYMLRPAAAYGYPGMGVATSTTPSMMANPLLMTSQAPPVASSAASAASVVDNNNTSPQPYKKLKTT